MNVFKFETKRYLKSCLTWGIICSLIILFFLSIYPSMRDSGMQDLVGIKLDAIPESMLKALGLEDMIDFTNILEYLAYSLQYIAMAAYIYALILGVNSLLEEESTGTIEFLYSKNISRREIVTSKILSRSFLLLLFLIILSISTTIFSIILKPQGLDTLDLIVGVRDMFLGVGLVSFVFLSIGVFLSTVLKPSYNFTSISIGVFFLTYVIGIASKLKESLSFLQYFSPFDYAMTMDVVKKGFEFKYIVTGFLIIALSIIFSYVIYEKKDMKI